jgi:hypothetical protein
MFDMIGGCRVLGADGDGDDHETSSLIGESRAPEGTLLEHLPVATVIFRSFGYMPAVVWPGAVLDPPLSAALLIQEPSPSSRLVSPCLSIQPAAVSIVAAGGCLRSTP